MGYLSSFTSLKTYQTSRGKYSLGFTFLLTLSASWLNETSKPNILTKILCDNYNCVSTWLNILNALNVYRYTLVCKHKGKNKQDMDIDIAC